jgi:hypothetical protein
MLYVSCGWRESLCIMISLCVGFLYIVNLDSFFLRCVERSRKYMELRASVSMVNFKMGCCSLISTNASFMFVSV